MGATEKSKASDRPNKGAKDGCMYDVDPLKLNLKTLRAKSTFDSGSSNGGNNSDNSALVSLDNNLFGFRFDSEEGSTRPNSEQNSEDSDGNGPAFSSAEEEKKSIVALKDSTEKGESVRTVKMDQESSPQHEAGPRMPAAEPSKSSLTTSSSSNLSNAGAAGVTDNSDRMTAEHQEAAANAVAKLKSIAHSYAQQRRWDAVRNKEHDDAQSECDSRKRKASAKSGNESTGHTTDDDIENASEGYPELPRAHAASSSHGVTRERRCEGGQFGGKSKKNKRMDDKKREERNAREKERSFRISTQINELRDLLSRGGVVVPKGTKSSVLTEAANYIRMLRQHQYKSEIDRHQLVQQMQLIGSGAHGPQAATAIRHVAAQNGVWSLGNFGGVPPESAMSVVEQAPSATEVASQDSSTPVEELMQPPRIETPDYRFIFNSIGAGMAIASMGGAFIDCNQLFCQISNYKKQEICSLTIFNLTARQDLQSAFDLIGQMISPHIDSQKNGDAPKPIVLRGSFKNRNDVGLSVSLVKSDDGIAKCFCVSLIKNPSSPCDAAKPVPLSFEAIMPQEGHGTSQADKGKNLNTSPAFTSG